MGGGPSLGREFSPPNVDLGYRAPRAPRLARSAPSSYAARAPWSSPAPTVDAGRRPVQSARGRPPVAVPEVPAAAVLGGRRPGARRRCAAIVGARRTRRARVPLLRTARDREDDDRADPREGAQLHVDSATTATRAVSARTACAIAAGTFLDLFELDAASNRGIENIRDVIESASLGLGPSARTKVYVLDEVHMLTDAAANALLEDARGGTGARGVRARDHEPGEGPPDHPVAHPALRVHAPLERGPHRAGSLGSLRAGRRHGRSRGPRDPRDGRCRIGARRGVAARPGARARRRPPRRRRRVAELFGGTAFPSARGSSRRSPREDAAGALVGLGDLLESGHEPRRVAEDLLAAARDAFLLTAARGRVHVSRARPTSRTTCVRSVKRSATRPWYA